MYHDILLSKVSYSRFKCDLMSSRIYTEKKDLWVLDNEEDLKLLYESIELPEYINSHLVVKAFTDIFLFETQCLVIPLFFKLLYTDKCYMIVLNHNILNAVEYVNINNIKNNVTFNAFNCKQDIVIPKGEVFLELNIMPRL